MLCGDLDGRQLWGRMGTSICSAESLCCSPETTTALLIGYTPIQDKKFKVWRKKKKDPASTTKAQCSQMNKYSLVALTVKESACSAGDLGSIPASGRSSEEENGNSLQYSCLENSMDGGVWQGCSPWDTKSWTRLSN